MRTVKLISWHEEIAAKATLLASQSEVRPKAKAKSQSRGTEIEVDATPLVRTSSVVTELATLDPGALVLDLDRRPSSSREIALMLRVSKSARHIPILFAGALPSEDGLPEKFERLNSELPDIPYAAWPDAPAALKKLLAEPRTAEHIVPPERVYTASLAQKLGILPGATKGSAKGTGEAAAKARQIALIGAPEGFAELLGELPETVKFTARLGPSASLALCFIRSWSELAPTLDMLTLRLPIAASAWIVYPKKAARRGEQFSEYDLRASALAAGFVDYKICSIDAEWTGMKFARRKAKS